MSLGGVKRSANIPITRLEEMGYLSLDTPITPHERREREGRGKGERETGILMVEFGMGYVCYA